LKSSAFNGGAADNISFEREKESRQREQRLLRIAAATATQGGCAGATRRPTRAPRRTATFTAPVSSLLVTTAARRLGRRRHRMAHHDRTGEARRSHHHRLHGVGYGDQIYDSSVLLDNFKWLPGDTMTGTIRPPN